MPIDGERTPLGGLDLDSFRMMGILNSFKTGDVLLDLVVAMCLPLLLKIVFSWGNKFEKWSVWQHLYRWLYGSTVTSTLYERIITETWRLDSDGCHFSMTANTQNLVLLKAINLYLDQVVKLHLRSAFLDLHETQNNNTDYCGTMYAILKGYDITSRIPPGHWHTLGTFGNGDSRGPVLLKIDQSHEGGSGENPGGDGNSNRSGSGPGSKTTTYTFQSETKEACDAFVTGAYRWYLRELEKKEPTNSRHFYEMKAKESSSGGGTGNRRGYGTAFKRYLLSDEKTFSNLFFPEKESLISLIDHFSNKTGKYSIPGYPYKVGILLHGPPG
jgi:mitochondrial chaperone BCS1